MKRSNVVKATAVIAVVGLMLVAVLTAPDRAIAQLPPGGGGPCETLINDAAEGADLDSIWEASCETEEQGGRRYLCGQASGLTFDLEYAVGRECVDLGPIDP